MKPKASIPTITLLLFSLALFAAQAAGQSSSAKQPRHSGQSDKTLTGVVSDNMCGATHMAKNKNAAECTRMCVKQGQKYALVVGKKIYTLNGHEAELDKMAGQKVKITGNVAGDVVSVSSVTSAKNKSAS